MLDHIVFNLLTDRFSATSLVVDLESEQCVLSPDSVTNYMTTSVGNASIELSDVYWVPATWQTTYQLTDVHNNLMKFSFSLPNRWWKWSTEWLGNFPNGTKQLYQFLIDVRDYHKIGGLNQPKFIISQFWRAEGRLQFISVSLSWSGYRVSSFRRFKRRVCVLVFSSFQRLPACLGSWPLPCITPSSASNITSAMISFMSNLPPFSSY